MKRKVKITLDGVEHVVHIRTDLIRKNGPPATPYCVTTESGERIACHATKEAAQRQLAAIEASKEQRGDSGDLVTRLDFGSFSKVERTPQGGLRIPSSLTRTGIFTYRRADGTTIRELRPAEEVFKADSLKTLKGAPVTDLHPGSRLVSSDNWSQVSVGHVADEVKHDSRLVKADVLVQDARVVRMVESGQRKEISCGYRCRMDETPGTFNGERYDAIQRDIQYNHVALGPPKWGRAGSEVSLHLDSEDAIMALSEERTNMKKVVIDGIEYEVGSEAYLQARARQVASLEEKNDSLSKENEELKGKVDGLTNQNKELEQKLDSAGDPKTMSEKIAARVALETKATKVLGEEAKFDGKTDRQVMEEALLHGDKGLKLDGKSDEYVEGMFGMLKVEDKRDDRGKSSIRQTRQDLDDKNKNTPRTPDQARQDMMERNQKAWEAPLAASSQKAS